jgi:tetratricopeptide (TPR) repeat protein
MAKHTRVSSRRASRKRVRPSNTSARTRRVRPIKARSVPAPHTEPHDEAVHIYEQGVEALQQRNYAKAARLLESVLSSYPEEKELHERVRVYLNVCQRQAAPPDRTPKSTEERVYAATLAINAGAYDKGLSELRQALERDPANDHIHYMLAVVHSLKGDFVSALPHLRRAIELNSDNRFLAQHDADFEALRISGSEFRSLVQAAVRSRGDGRASQSRPLR